MTLIVLRVCSLLSLMVAAVYAQTQAGSLHCLYDGLTYSMVLVVNINSDPVTIMYAQDAAGVKDNNCKSGGALEYIQSIGSGAATYWKVVVTFDGASFTSDDDCGPEKPDASVNEYVWRFATRRKPESEFSSLLFASDMNYVATCNFESMLPNLIFSSAIAVTGETLNTLTVMDEDVKMTVTEEDGITGISSSSLGNNIRLRMELTPAVDGATGISPYKCKACDEPDCSGISAYTLTDSDGCYVLNQHIDSLGDDSFIGSGLNVLTIPFINFVFSGSSQTVYFICNVDFCYGSGTSTLLCENRCQNSKKRRRRDADDEKNITSLVGLTINVDKETPRITKEKDIKEYLELCDIHMIFLGVTLALVILLVASVIFSIRMYCIMGKQKEKTLSKS